jgi:hypothetical protein
MMLGSDEELMLFWGYRSQPSIHYYILLIVFGNDEKRASITLHNEREALM